MYAITPRPMLYLKYRDIVLTDHNVVQLGTMGGEHVLYKALSRTNDAQRFLRVRTMR